MTTPPPTQTPETHALQCLEVWGGTSAADHAASVPGLDISVNSRPVEGSDAGGDIFLISSCSSGWITRVLLADVSGHGDAVSGLSKQLRKAMHKSINTVDQSKLARSLNNSFEDISSGSKFATALLMTYFAPTGHLIFVNAGHPPPLLRKSGSDEWVPVEQSTHGVLKTPSKELRVGIKNLPLGVIKSTEYEQIAVKFEEGDELCAYTDAFTEAQHSDGSLLGTSGLAASLQRSGAAERTEYASAVLSDLGDRGFNKAEDDHTMLMLRHNGQGASSVGTTTISNYLKNGLGLGHTDTVVA